MSDEDYYVNAKDVQEITVRNVILDLNKAIKSKASNGGFGCEFWSKFSRNKLTEGMFNHVKRHYEQLGYDIQINEGLDTITITWVKLKYVNHPKDFIYLSTMHNPSFLDMYGILYR